MRNQPFLGRTTLSDHLGWMSDCISCITIRVNRSNVLRSCPLTFRQPNSDDRCHADVSIRATWPTCDTSDSHGYSGEKPTERRPKQCSVRVESSSEASGGLCTAPFTMMSSALISLPYNLKRSGYRTTSELPTIRRLTPTVVCVSAACQSRAGKWHSCLSRAVKRS